jgi:hypothetical protein
MFIFKNYQFNDDFKDSFENDDDCAFFFFRLLPLSLCWCAVIVTLIAIIFFGCRDSGLFALLATVTIPAVIMTGLFIYTYVERKDNHHS